MKRSNIHIILFAFVALSFSVFNLFTTAKNNTAFVAENPIASLNKTINSADAEIEYCTSHINSLFQVQHGFQKGAECTYHQEKPVLLNKPVTQVNNFAYVELYSNNYLEHNYPSHNFW